MAYHHGQLRRALMDAALDLIAESGPGGLTLRGAARRAGVSPSAPYRHFADKEALLAAVAAEGFSELADQLDEVSAQLEDPVGRILALGTAYVHFATRDGARYRLMFGHEIPSRSAHPELEEAAARTHGHLARAVADAHAEGSIEGDQRSVTLLAWSVVHGLSSLVIDGHTNVPGEPAAVDRLAEQLGRLLLNGIKRA